MFSLPKISANTTGGITNNPPRAIPNIKATTKAEKMLVIPKNSNELKANHSAIKKYVFLLGICQMPNHK